MALYSQTYLLPPGRGKLPDVVDRKTRSRMMSGIRSRDTRPERLIRTALHRMGFRFRLHSPKVAGRPDLVLAKYRAAIHVHGCFWHGHDCELFQQPGTRVAFWKKKLRKNRIRDRVVLKRTIETGWRHLTIWECALRGPRQLGVKTTSRRAAAWIRGSRRVGVMRSRTK
jgi:DNA mismatch endonuclease (patch repair protein)